MSTSDLPWGRRVDTIRALLEALKQPHNSWLERWAVFARWVGRSPEYVDWLLRAHDAQVARIAELEAELGRLRARAESFKPPRLPPPPLPPRSMQEEIDADLEAFADAFREPQE